jgi:hypothetical protein
LGKAKTKDFDLSASSAKHLHLQLLQVQVQVSAYRVLSFLKGDVACQTSYLFLAPWPAGTAGVWYRRLAARRRHALRGRDAPEKLTMDLYEALLRGEHGRGRSKHALGAGRARAREQQFGDFECGHCRLGVSAEPRLSGVQNRNHCPYCLWSKHVDLQAAGDRLCACKGLMRPVGLALKRTKKKYASASARGELMLVHRCAGCGALSLNRVAADDSAGRLRDVFEASLAHPPEVGVEIELVGVTEAEWMRAALGQTG